MRVFIILITHLCFNNYCQSSRICGKKTKALINAMSLVPGLASAVMTRKEEAAEQNRRKNSQPYKRPPARVAVQEEVVEYDEEEGFSDQCPEPNGYFPDAEQCDKYYDCRDGKMNEKLCPDGLVFNDFSPQQEKCDLPFGLDCSKRPKLRECLS